MPNALQRGTGYLDPAAGKTDKQVDYLVIDGSGSMRDKWWPLMDALDEYVVTARSEGVDTHIIASVFDSFKLDDEQRNEHINQWKSPREKPIEMHGGGTPLYDAVNLVGRKLRDLDPPRAAITFVTDGQNTYSSIDVTQAKAIIEWMKAKGWQVTFIGANFANDEQARQLGVDKAAAIGVEKSQLKNSMKALGQKRGRYGKEGTDMHFSEGERSQFGGYLSGPSK